MLLQPFARRHSLEQGLEKGEVCRRCIFSLTEGEDRRAAHGIRLALVAGDRAHERASLLLVALSQPEHGRFPHGLGTAAREGHQRGYTGSVGDHRERADRRALETVAWPG